ncbi:hypothetical protein [Humibacter sp. RRB41]|uniref:hypothetical protein n=1 Tax=Humibacter sp. RRB41 TaxID=2919946 RepID=UPI001FA9A6D5|nr:hypothetical protein [Humibacter sp. RRB41]
MSVAQWLVRTEHGNNGDVVADAAASAAPSEFDFSNTSHIAAVDALLALRAASGKPVGELTARELREAAVAADPEDSCLVAEIGPVQDAWGEWADLLADAAYSPAGASELLERRHKATTPSAGSAGPLSAEAEALVVALVHALAVDRPASLVVNDGLAPSLASELVGQLNDDVEVVASSQPEGRRIRRRLLCAGLISPIEHIVSGGPRLSVERLPLSGATSASEILQAVDELALGMKDQDRAIVVAPATVLAGPLATDANLARTDVLRTGRVRAIVKLPAGLVVSSPREHLALWVLGRETGHVAVADRVTAVAGLTDNALTEASRSDLINDVLAALGSVQGMRSHAFRFARLVRTSSLIASRGPLVPDTGAPRAQRLPARDLPALLDQAHLSLGEDAPAAEPVPASTPALTRTGAEELITGRHLRVISGTRLSADEVTESGLVVVGVDDLDDPSRIGQRRLEPLAFAGKHPSTHLTVAGDVVFRTSPTAKAWVDPDGSKVVAYPARVLRISAADPGGLVPEIIAADINRSAGGPASWRRWQLRRVPPILTAPLRTALVDLAARRESLLRRTRALDSYTELLTDAVVAGVVAFPHTDTDAETKH